MLNHLEKNKILTNLNHGFRSGYSCETQLLVTLDELLHFNDKGLQTDIAILDFSKAFDTVPHEELLCKLESYGITGSLHEWLRKLLIQETYASRHWGGSIRESHRRFGRTTGQSLDLFYSYVT